MSRSFESVQWNTCVHRLYLGLYSHAKDFYGMESEPISTPREALEHKDQDNIQVILNKPSFCILNIT